MANKTSELILTEDKHIMCSVAVAAVHCDITARRLHEYVKEHQIPKEGSRIDLAALLKERRETFSQQETKATDAERKTKAEADLKEKQSEKEAIIVAHMEGQIVYVEHVQDALTSLFAEIQGKCIASDNTSESDLLLLGVPQDTVNEYMRKRRDRTNAMLTEFASGGQSAFAKTVGAKPKRSYTKGAKGISAAAAGNGQ